MNLSNIKRVGFIENFNPKMGYPEFARQAEAPKEAKSKQPTTVKEAVVKEIPKWKKKRIKAIKKAKKEFKSRTDSNYKPTIAATNKLG